MAALRDAVEAFAVDAIRQQLAMGGRRDHAIVLGKGRNLRLVERLNDEHGFFDRLHVLEHPRFIMQYKRRSLDVYLRRYQHVLAAAANGAAD